MKIVTLALILTSALTLTSHAAYSQGSNFAQDFDGSNDFITTGASLVAFGIDRTYEAWFKTSTITSGFNAIFTMEEQVNFGSNLTFMQVMLNASGQIYVNGANNAPIFTSTNSYNDNQWHHIAYVVDAITPSSGDMQIYVDGMLVGTRSYTSIGASNPPDTEFRIGNSEYLGGSYFMDGTIDEVRIWNAALSQLEIRENMCQKLNGTEPNLAAYYRMDEGIDNTCPGGEDVCDLTGNGNHGTKF